MFEKVEECFISLDSRDEPVFDLLPPVSKIEDQTSLTFNPDTLSLSCDLNDYIQADTSPMCEDHEGYFISRHFEYWISSLVTAKEMLTLAAKYGLARRRYIDLGSASGRVIGHLAYKPNGFAEN